jgi:ubiquinone biosynthesis protein
VPPFSTEYAIKTIERASGKPLTETFAVFDPVPIGSASIACVYQAVLKNGDKVAVKVRRPNIGHKFATDIKAIGTLISLMELLTLIRPGYLDNFVHEFRSTIFEELDFKMEAYYQTIFRRDARKRGLGKKFFTAPKVYFEHSNKEVIVEEYVSGIWMWEIIAAIENKNAATLERMRELGIQPKQIAERLVFMQMWGQFIATIFHADPHPANIVVQRGGKLVFVDFGACGSMSSGKRRMMLDYMVAVSKRDVAASVRSVIGFLEPLPPIDMNSFIKEMEIDMGQALLRLWSKRAPWYEKTSAAGYFKAMALTQKYQVPVSLDTVRTFRANMLYDTLAMRIDPDLDMVGVVKDFLKDTRKATKEEAKKALRRRLKRGLLDGTELQIIDEVKDVTGRVIQFARRYLDRPLVNFTYMVEKSVFAVVATIRFFAMVVFMTAVAIFGVAAFRIRYGLSLDISLILGAVFSSTIYYSLIALMGVITLRRITLRLRDQDTSKR